MSTDENTLCNWFENHYTTVDDTEIRVLVLDEDYTPFLKEFMISAIPSCYISIHKLKKKVKKSGLSASEVLENKLPDPGSVMAGDFGEILTLFFLDCDCPKDLRKVKKWRYKQDRRKPAPHSDVVLLYKKNDDKSSRRDFVICAEVKSKATNDTRNHPIQSAIEGSNTDWNGRLARTLVWLKEKAIDYGDSNEIEFFRRFSDEQVNKTYEKKFKAVAVIDGELLDDELDKDILFDDELEEEIEVFTQSNEFEVVAIEIPELKALYESCFSGALKEVQDD